MILVIKEIGLCTSRIGSVDELSDLLVEPRVKKENNTRESTDTIEQALLEADAAGIPIISVGINLEEGEQAGTLAEALLLASKMDEAAIVCIQNGEGEGLDVAVIKVDTKENKPAWASISGIERSNINVISSRFQEIYGQSGPVCDAGSLIVGCIALRCGMDFSTDGDGERFLAANAGDSRTLEVNVTNGMVILKQPLVAAPIKLKMDNCIIPLSFRTKEELEKKLKAVEKLSYTYSAASISHSMMSEYKDAPLDAKMVVMAAGTNEALRTDIEDLLLHKEEWLERGFTWRTMSGSCYTATPVGAGTKICLMNPPGGMSSKLSFYRLYRILPELKEYLADFFTSKESGNSLVNSYYFEVVMGMLAVQALKELGITFDAAIGGDLGEISLPFVLNIADTDIRLLKSRESVKESLFDIMSLMEEIVTEQNSATLFRHKAGEMERWYLKCNSQRVKALIEETGKRVEVYLTVVGSSEDVIICGKSDACQLIITNLKCRAVKLKDSIYAHTPIMEAYKTRLAEVIRKNEIHIMKTNTVAVYSTEKLKPLDNTIEALAENFAESMSKPVNMQHVFNQAYRDGYRIFIDLGSGQVLSAWARENFKEKENTLITSLFEDGSGKEGLFKLLTQFMTNRVILDVDKFINRFEWPEPEEFMDSAGMQMEKEITMDEPVKESSVVSKATEEESVEENDMIEEGESFYMTNDVITEMASGNPDLEENADALIAELVKRQMECNFKAYQSYLTYQNLLLGQMADEK